MDLHNIIYVVVGVIAILGAIYKVVQTEANINIKIINLETKGFLTIDNLKDSLSERITTIDRKIDIHLQDYINYKDAILLQGKGLDERISHTWAKTKELLTDQKTEIKELQISLQRQHDSKPRE